jgi:hypothetical protein
MQNIIQKKGLAIGIILIFLFVNPTLGISVSNKNRQILQVIQQNIQSIIKDVIEQTHLVSNVLISNNAGNDYHPRMTTNILGHTIVVYEQEIGINTKEIPVVYSVDEGQTWTEQLLFNSNNFTEGSGVLEYPDIVYNERNDVLYLTMIDSNAEMYNDEMCFIPGDIANCIPEEVKTKWYGISACGDDYLGNAAATTENFFLSMTIRNGTLNRYLDLYYFTYPNYEQPLGIGGVYPDFESVHKTSPASNIEMDTGNRIYLVAESDVEEGPKITIKSATSDEKLLTSGEQQNGMDKYADIEQWPGEYIAFGTDPDVATFGNNVYVVYNQNGMIKCSYSNAESSYEPNFNWQVSIIENGASTPAVYVQGSSVYCAYVKDGNLYMKTSEDNGLTWGVSEKKNSVDGMVVSLEGAVAICESGITFIDKRNGNYDIYFAPLLEEPSGNNGPVKPNKPSGQINGKAGEEYTYTTSTIDPNGDKVYYLWDWGDGNYSGWLGPYNSGVTCEAKHIWTKKNNYNIKVKAKDIYGKDSIWSDPLSVTMPKNKPYINTLIQNFLENHPIIYQLI